MGFEDTVRANTGNPAFVETGAASCSPCAASRESTAPREEFSSRAMALAASSRLSPISIPARTTRGRRDGRLEQDGVAARLGGLVGRWRLGAGGGGALGGGLLRG